jgi:hypothetical protein
MSYPFVAVLPPDALVASRRPPVPFPLMVGCCVVVCHPFSLSYPCFCKRTLSLIVDALVACVFTDNRRMLLVLEDLASGPPGTLLSSCPRYRPTCCTPPFTHPPTVPYHTDGCFLTRRQWGPQIYLLPETISSKPECTDLPNKSHYKKWDT